MSEGRVFRWNQSTNCLHFVVGDVVVSRCGLFLAVAAFKCWMLCTSSLNIFTFFRASQYVNAALGKPSGATPCALAAGRLSIDKPFGGNYDVLLHCLRKLLALLLVAGCCLSRFAFLPVTFCVSCRCCFWLGTICHCFVHTFFSGKCRNSQTYKLENKVFE